MENFSEYLLGLSEQKYILLGLILSFSFLSYLLMRYVVIKAIFHLFEKTSTKLDDILIQKGFLNRLSYIVPLIIVYNLFTTLIGNYEIVNRLILALIAIVIVAFFAIGFTYWNNIPYLGVCMFFILNLLALVNYKIWKNLGKIDKTENSFHYLSYSMRCYFFLNYCFFDKTSFQWC